MQTSAPEHPGLCTIEDPISKILAQIKRTTTLTEVLDLPVEVYGLVLGPPHPRAQMLQVGINGRFEEWCVLWVPAPQDEAGGVDTIGRTPANG
jgi:hypothetical protein